MIRLHLTQHDGTVLYLSTRAGEYSGQVYSPGVVSMDDITWRMKHKTGGICEYEYGSFKLAPDVVGVIPDVDFAYVELWYYGFFFFGGKARLQSWDQTGAIYDFVKEAPGRVINGKVLGLLDTAEGYSGEIIDLPMAFGAVEHVEPVRLPDVATAPTYHMGRLVGTNVAKDVASQADNGSGDTRITTSAAHGFTTGDTVTIEGDTTWTGAVTVIDTTHFDTGLAYDAGLSFGHAFKDGYFRAYDSGWPISGNVTVNGDGSFSLSATPVGDVTMSGASVLDYVGEVVARASSRTVYSGAPSGINSTAINIWIDRQMDPLAFLDEVLSSVGGYAYWQLPGYSPLTWGGFFFGEITPTETPVALEESVYGPGGYDVPRLYVDDTIAGATYTWQRRTASGSAVTETTETAAVDSLFPYGDRRDIELYNSMPTDAESQLLNWINYQNRPYASVAVPFVGLGSSIFGFCFIVQDRETGEDLTFCCRGFQLSFRDGLITYFGELIADIEMDTLTDVEIESGEAFEKTIDTDDMTLPLRQKVLFSQSGAPSWVTVSPQKSDAMTLSGTPSADGTDTVTISATDGEIVVSKDFDIIVGASAGWWNLGSATCLAAWQAKGAASAAAALLDLTGNGYDLSGASPTWTAADGWTSYVGFDAVSGLTLPSTITVVWAGLLQYAGSGSLTAFANSAGDWSGLQMHAYSGPSLYAGYNANMTPRLSATVAGVAGVLIYQKNGTTGAQALYDNDVLKASNTSGTAPGYNSLMLFTGVRCKAAAVFSGTLSSADITAVTNALNSL